MAEARLDIRSIGITVDERRQVEVAHGTEIAIDLGPEEIDQADTLEVSQYG
jgi:hypothetical protein